MLYNAELAVTVSSTSGEKTTLTKPMSFDFDGTLQELRRWIESRPKEIVQKMPTGKVEKVQVSSLDRVELATQPIKVVAEGKPQASSPAKPWEKGKTK